ncbi:MAG: adenylyltransferase/cytidyltransferase family protein [Crocinitomicaceae bacterium]
MNYPSRTRLEHMQHKIVDLASADRRVKMWKLKANKVTFTNGCFDILHQGHVTYLAGTASYGTKLVVGLNSDASVKKQEKGDNRPVNSEDARALVLAALGYVDMVVIYDDETPIELIKTFEPEVLAKGADYDADETDASSKKYIVGSKEVKSKGGKVVAIPLVEGFSTTAIIEKMNA